MSVPKWKEKSESVKASAWSPEFEPVNASRPLPLLV